MSGLLEARGVCKSFPGVQALKNVDFSARSGEIHALVGANGAGKSTLMNIFAGTSRPNAGELRLNGAPVRFDNPVDAQNNGIATVYQEFSLIPELDVARNIYLGREPTGRYGLVDRRRLRVMARELLDRYDLKVFSDAKVNRLSVADQQIVEIARALSLEANILILDEPSAVLSVREQKNLFAILKQLRRAGMLVLYVSHFLNEVLEIADRVTVLKDGTRVTTRPVKGLTAENLAELMLGRKITHAPDHRDVADSSTIGGYRIEYDGSKGPGKMTIAPGEIVGLAGLVGAGRTTFARAIAGFPPPEGKIEVYRNGKKVDIGSVRKALAAGIFYLTEDRKTEGLFTQLDILANTTASALKRLRLGIFRARRKEERAAGEVLERMHLVSTGLDALVMELSGGNQQKVILARALLGQSELLICDEPTRGVDIGAKNQIYKILRELAGDGAAILVISSEIDELLILCDRIVVMHDRQFVSEMAAADADESKLFLAASGTVKGKKK